MHGTYFLSGYRLQEGGGVANNQVSALEPCSEYNLVSPWLGVTIIMTSRYAASLMAEDKTGLALWLDCKICHRVLHFYDSNFAPILRPVNCLISLRWITKSRVPKSQAKRLTDCQMAMGKSLQVSSPQVRALSTSSSLGCANQM